MGKVSFGGVTKRVCLAYTPEAEVGDYVVVHVGFAISRIDEAEARKVFETLRELGELAELEVPQPDPADGEKGAISMSTRLGWGRPSPRLEGGRGIEGEGGGAIERASLSPLEGGRGIEGAGG
jgi:hydrogenase expression/formation protein HypC